MKFRWQIIRILLAKQLLRLKKNVAAFALLGLLLAIAVLMATGSRTIASNPKGESQQRSCVVVFFAVDVWMEHLLASVPDDLDIKFEVIDESEMPEDGPIYPSDACVIEVYPKPFDQGGEHRVRFLYPRKKEDLVPFTQWFWKNTTEFFSGGESIAE